MKRDAPKQQNGKNCNTHFGPNARLDTGIQDIHPSVFYMISVATSGKELGNVRPILTLVDLLDDDFVLLFRPSTLDEYRLEVLMSEANE